VTTVHCKTTLLQNNKLENMISWYKLSRMAEKIGFVNRNAATKRPTIVKYVTYVNRT